MHSGVLYPETEDVKWEGQVGDMNPGWCKVQTAGLCGDTAKAQVEVPALGQVTTPGQVKVKTPKSHRPDAKAKVSNPT